MGAGKGGRKTILMMNYFLSGWTWIAAKRTTGCLTTLSVRRLFRHNCPISLLENITLKQSKFIFIYGSHCYQSGWHKVREPGNRVPR